jgi:signal transduction histidine kinase
VIVGKDYLSHEGFVEVIDQGKGMNREEIDRLGIPFFSTKKGGTGLGLSVSYSIIQAHHGRIEVDSTVRGGTKFRICLPDNEKLQAMKSRQDADT